jgi:hypothetical protein|tara:strand:+ start:216 stop:398 length:183 start_codon:yes stop_codon:yes gene_type:complete
MSTFLSNINRSIINESIIYDTSDDILKKSEKLLSYLTTDYEFDMVERGIIINFIDDYFNE